MGQQQMKWSPIGIRWSDWLSSSLYERQSIPSQRDRDHLRFLERHMLTKSSTAVLRLRCFS